MTAAAILTECARRGIHLRADGDLIRYRPRDAVDTDPDLLGAMRERKAELLAHLRRSVDVRVGPWQPPGRVAPPRQCVSCEGGLQPDDPDNAVCSTCVHYFSIIEPRRLQ
jgi:hypothetical protein